MDHELLYHAYQSVANGKKCAFATIVESTEKGSPRKPGAKMVVYEDGTFEGTIGGGWCEEDVKKACLKVIKTKKPYLASFDFQGGKPASYCGGQIKVFVEPLEAVKNFILCGAGHIALPLSFMMKMLNYRVTVLDDRKAYANKKRFPHADKIMVGHPAKSLGKLSLGPADHIMIVTHAHAHDYECLKAVVSSKAAYIGVISSHAKKLKMQADLKKAGIASRDIRRVNIPAGIDIGAQTPQEIAVSICAEIVSLENQSYVGSAKFKEKR